MPRVSLFIMLVLATLAIPMQGCRKAKNTYDQSSPEAVLTSAQKMVVNGDSRRLTELVAADNPDLRALYTRLGLLLGDLEDLAIQLNTSFPKEIEELKQQAKAAAESGKTNELFAQFTRQQPQRRRGPARPAERTELERDPRSAINTALRQLLVDPFAWLDENASRLSVVPINDDMSALMWDSKPIFPPVGLVIQKSMVEDNTWYLVLPTHLPPLSRLMPRTPEEYAVWIQLVDAFRNVAIDVRKDVAAGKLQDLEQVSRAAGERAFIPMAFIGVAYGNLMDERRRAERAARNAATQAPSIPGPG